MESTYFRPPPDFLDFDLSDEPQSQVPMIIMKQSITDSCIVEEKPVGKHKMKTRSDIQKLKKIRKKAFVLHEYTNILILEPNSTISGIKTCLVIDLEKYTFEEIPLYLKFANREEKKDDFVNSTKLKESEFQLLLGFLTIEQQDFIVFVNESKQVLQINDATYWKIDSLYYHPIGFRQIEEGKKTLLRKKLKAVKDIIEKHAFYAFKADVTLRIGDKGKTRKEYMLNKEMMIDMAAFHCKQYQIPVILGDITSSNLKKPVQSGDRPVLRTAIISRRMIDGFDPKNVSMALNENGDAGLFSEIESIFFDNNMLKTSTMLKGSLRFRAAHIHEGLVEDEEKQNYVNKTQEEIFTKHFQKLNKSYGVILLINLLSLKNPEEKLLVEHIEGVYQRCKDQLGTIVKYKYKDVSVGPENSILRQIHELVAELFPIHKHFGFRTIDSNNTIISDQTGCFRFNCPDGVCFSDISLMMFFYYNLSTFNFVEPDLESVYLHLTTRPDKMNLSVRSMFTAISNTISYLYYGQNSPLAKPLMEEMPLLLKEARTKQIKYDKKKRDELITFKKVMLKEQTGFMLEKNINRLNLGQEYKVKKKLSLQIISWNVGGYKPPSVEHIESMFLNIREDQPDILVIGLQEIFEMKGKNIGKFMTSDENKGNSWRDLFQIGVSKTSPYLFVEEKTLVGLYCILFAKPEISERIRKVEFKEIKLGMNLGVTQLGNKGSLVLSFLIDGVTLKFAICHLAAGQKLSNNQVRINQIKKVVENGLKDQMCYRFLIGDLNFRLSMPFESVKQSLEKYEELDNNLQIGKAKGILTDMLETDQLLSAIKDPSIHELNVFKEAEINFKPTYKMFENQDAYKNNKNRTPSWTDRIIFSEIAGEELEVVKYGRTETLGSDHRPVYLLANLEMMTFNTEKVKDDILLSKLVFEA